MATFLLALQLNTPEFKYLMIVLAAPLWLPFLKALWVELNDMLAEEGGLLGRPPSEKELREIRRRKAQQGLSMVSEPREDRGAGRAGGARRPSAPGRGGRPGLGGPRRVRGRGFGSPRS